MRARRKDRNQAEIERGLRCHPGVYVFDTSAVGGGYPDLNVGYQGRTYMFEVKDPQQPLSKQRMTQAEVKFATHYTGRYAVILTLDEALRVVGIVIND